MAWVRIVLCGRLMDVDRLGQAGESLVQRVQGLTGGRWLAIVAFSVLAVVAGWSWIHGTPGDSNPWITLTPKQQGSSVAAPVDSQQLTRLLQAAGIAGFRFERNQLQVRATDVEQALQVLADATQDDDGWTAKWENSIGQLGAFPTAAQYEQARQIALRKDIRQLLKAVPEIADVQVLLARSEARRSFGSRAQRVTATIGIRPHEGVNLGDSQIEMLRQVVAGGVPDLEPDDVVIFDQSTLSPSEHSSHLRNTQPTEAVVRAQEPDNEPGSSGRGNKKQTSAAVPGRGAGVDRIDRPVVTTGAAGEATWPTWVSPLLAAALSLGVLLAVLHWWQARNAEPTAVEPSLATHWEKFDELAEAATTSDWLVENDARAAEADDGNPDPDQVGVSDPVADAAHNDSGDEEQPAAEDLGDVADDEPGRLGFLADADPAMLAGWLTDETPQLAAVIASQLPADLRESVLDNLSGQLKRSLTRRLDEGVVVHDDVLMDLAEMLKDRWRDAETGLVADVVSMPSPSTISLVGWSAGEVALLQAVDGVLPHFDDLVNLDGAVIRRVYDLVGAGPFRQALSGTTPESRQSVLDRLSPLARMELVQAIEQQGVVRLNDIQRSQREILKHARRVLAAADSERLGRSA